MVRRLSGSEPPPEPHSRRPLTRQLLSELGDNLPGGWSVGPVPTDAGFDLIATSPAGALFPIEVKETGDIDVSTVVEFGAVVEDRATELVDYSPKPVDDKHLFVKPLLVTPGGLPEASADYAVDFRIDVVCRDTPTRTRGSSRYMFPEIGPDRTDVGATDIVRRVADHLTYWSGAIEDVGHGAEDLGVTRDSGDWFLFGPPP